MRFITPDVVQEGTERQIAMLVRGTDSYGHFDLAEPPAPGQSSPEGGIHSEALRRMMTNLMPKDFKSKDYDESVSQSRNRDRNGVSPKA